ncbi:hypothetical protein J2S74_004693 [Evansella vedderi]|uniref:DUF3231 family protein n=1 Tax=Evansella vedderi TaxID=38282 RepID=A0ABU0A193_9BACI|nr:DUF3231 family protein [Evansella vedderi]MDQ0257235.1 hypothetical protein [Evansella vedderi]
MENTKDQALTSAELSQLWQTYMGDTSQICVLSYFANTVENSDIKSNIEFALDRASGHVDFIANMFKADGHEVPKGFSVTEDVDVNAPRIFSDDFMLEFLHQFARIGLRVHALNLSLAVRKDCTSLFKQCVEDSVKLYEATRDLLLEKGLFIRSPYLQSAHKVDFIQHQNFLTGFFGDKRPLLAPEVTNLYANFQRNALGTATMLGFMQTAESEDVIKYITRGKEIAEKHCEVFNSFLGENDLPASLYWDSQVTENTHRVFSDKLMMFMTASLTNNGIAFYGLGVGSSLRKDLGVMYNRLIAEIQMYGEDGANIMIDHGWLESPPKAKDL